MTASAADNARAALDEAATRFAAARLWAAHQAPYLASAVFALTPVTLEPNLDDTTGRPIADPEFAAFPADTRWQVYVDPGTVLVTPPEQIGWWLLHQVGHLVRKHASRSPVKPAPGAAGVANAQGWSGGHDPLANRWNQAADAEINDDLEAEGLTGPPGAISPAALGLPGNRMAEEYMSMLDVLDDALSKGGVALAEAVGCGGAVDGLDHSYEDTGSGDGLSTLERELLERSIAKGIQERAAMRSPVPGGWARWAEERLQPEVDWRARIGSLIRKGLTEATGRVDFSYRRPSRRSAAYDGVVVPSLARPLPESVVVIDTSGSISKPVLTRLITEITGIIDKVSGPQRRLRAICCDAVAHPVQEVRHAEDIQLVGGGGTDMRAGIEAATALRPAPDLIVVMTDGETPWPERRPAATVVVCLIGDDGDAPRWATQVRIPKEGQR